MLQAMQNNASVEGREREREVENSCDTHRCYSPQFFPILANNIVWQTHATLQITSAEKPQL